MNKTKAICYLIGSASIRAFNLHAGKKEDSKKNNWRHVNTIIYHMCHTNQDEQGKQSGFKYFHVP
jgi:hypothetical protein